jgi:hypothetical protein
MQQKNIYMKAAQSDRNVQTHPTTNLHVPQDLHTQMQYLCVPPLGQHTPHGHKLNQTDFPIGGHILAGFSLCLAVITLTNEIEQRKYLF